MAVKSRPEYPQPTGRQRPSGPLAIRASGHQAGRSEFDRRSPARLRLALLSGALLALCFPGPDLGWLAWVALVPLFMALLDSAAGQAVRPRQGAWLGFVAGGVFIGALLYWIWIFGWYAWLALTLYEAIWFGLFGALAVALLRRAPRALGPPALAAAWTVVEWARGLGTLGLTWGDLAVSQHRILPVLQMLDWTGPWGLTFLIALVNASFAALVTATLTRSAPTGSAMGDSRTSLECGGSTPLPSPATPPTQRGAVPDRSLALRWLAASMLVVGLLTARGAWLLTERSEAHGAGGRDATLPVAVVQGNVDQDVAWDGDYWRRTMSAHAQLTLEAARAGARLVVWSETSLPGELRTDASLRRVVSRLARMAQAELIVGSNDRLGKEDYNRAFLIDRDGRVRGGYAKRHLVPYGECVPLRAWFPFMDALHVRPFNLTPGEGYFPLRGDHRLGAVICFESAFPEISRATTRNGAEILVEITNDTWFGRTSAAAQHAAMAPLRAVETRRALARSTATGISTLVDDHGRVLRRLGLFHSGYLLERLPLRRDLTPYVRFGDWPVGLSLLFCLLLLGRSGLSAFRLRRPAPPRASGS